MLNDINETIITTLTPHPEIQLAFVFGSANSGKMRQDSDVDIAVLTKSKLTINMRLTLREELSLALRREVDIVDLFTAYGTILKQTLTKGTLILNRSQQEYVAIIKRMLYDQADMEPLRRRIIEKSLQRGFFG
ncbi:type VII toxin-antitoxin system MntA family adenylyltransferase antitoxin [Desulfobaculum bizertense]|uniref:Nucleotidyltransferase domain-containing protein n=1 Tax=Desulfobaculum bizertense DSM 18034 TaxID=1121442 RepID=A0A1T4W4M4_9BACT|nr:nucleotidyltransferase domain-containing protein [Desulfobaculum bizertense]SKA71985.1 Nucleotidyltransferase domain-containing protein [Desulfobaculum bizertense DSM 18034]